jgi:hypothetical protein
MPNGYKVFNHLAAQNLKERVVNVRLFIAVEFTN